MNRHTIVQLNYSLSQADGYLTDPYKILVRRRSRDGQSRGRPGRQRLDLYLFESRPDDARQAKRLRRS